MPVSCNIRCLNENDSNCCWFLVCSFADACLQDHSLTLWTAWDNFVVSPNHNLQPLIVFHVISLKIANRQEVSLYSSGCTNLSMGFSAFLISRSKITRALSMHGLVSTADETEAIKSCKPTARNLRIYDDNHWLLG